MGSAARMAVRWEGLVRIRVLVWGKESWICVMREMIWVWFLREMTTCVKVCEEGGVMRERQAEGEVTVVIWCGVLGGRVTLMWCEIARRE